MDRKQAEQFAKEWIRNWCERDVEAIVSHFSEDARFVSPVAAKRTGNALVVGRDALRAYWAVVHTFRTFAFQLERTVWDEERTELVIVYTREVDGRRDRACELLRFNDAGQVVEGEAMYGAEIAG